MERWSKEKACAWWEKQSWVLGFNYVPTYAVNDIEMWMDDTFNPELIREELKLARDTGFNSVRVFLSYAVWQNEGKVFERNFDRFLEIAEECDLSVLPLLFDDCAFDFGAEPVYGKQPEPVPGVCLSRWVPSPGFKVQDDPAQLAGCEYYVRAIVGAHRDDARILAWDLYNEPGNTNRAEKCIPLLTSAFKWARAENPAQPLTAGIFMHYDSFKAVNDILVENSDIVSLHTYFDLEMTTQLLDKYAACGRPIFITEWLHRPLKSLHATHLPLFYERKIASWQWGLVPGRVQDNLWWETQNGGTPNPDPDPWQHDIYYPDHTPYKAEELEIIKAFAAKING